MSRATESEFRSYPYIIDRLKDMGWDTRSPGRGGAVYTQNEATKQNAKLKEALGAERPEYVVAVRENDFWVIEAKADVKELPIALEQAKGRAKQINSVQGVKCHFITGFAGTPDSTHYIETHCLVSGKWKPLQINNRQSTGFISPEQSIKVLEGGKGRLDDYDIEDKLFTLKIAQINDILHNGAFHKRNRAGALACLLLALANDQNMPLNDNPATLISDINSRAKRELTKYEKQNFYEQIYIHEPTSTDNHIKNRSALAESIGILRDLNIASTINSGRDILGQCYEQFLKYASDAKEIGIVLTPRHITKFGAQVIDIQKSDIVFDPTCGTGGFLVAALDKVRKDCGDTDSFKKGNLHGVEQDALIATLAIVNMVFRGDGSSNITEGDCLKTGIPQQPHKVLMNPPFALRNEKEWEFVDKALEQMKKGGLLFAILPTNTMNSSEDGRREITWRTNLIKRHTLISVVKMPEELFYPLVSKGTYGVVIKAHRQHLPQDKVLWAVLRDGVVRTKTQGIQVNNMEKIITATKNYIATQTEPEYVPAEIDCSPLSYNLAMDMSPENYLGKDRQEGEFDIRGVFKNIEDGERSMDYYPEKQTHPNCRVFPLLDFFDKLETGSSGRKKEMGGGRMPLISTSEKNNGISAMVDTGQCRKIYPSGLITISKNGSCGCAHYHTYKFAANSDVFVGWLKSEYNNKEFATFLCSAINSENWRFNYYRKLTKGKIQQLKVKIPITSKGEIDTKRIEKITGDFTNA